MAVRHFYYSTTPVKRSQMAGFLARAQRSPSLVRRSLTATQRTFLKVGLGRLSGMSGGERVSTRLPERALPCGHRRKKSALRDQFGRVRRSSTPAQRPRPTFSVAVLRVAVKLAGCPLSGRRKKSNPAAAGQPGCANHDRRSGDRYFAAARRLLTSFQLMTL